MADPRFGRHPEDKATCLISDVAATTLESVKNQHDFEAMIDRLGQGMGLLSELAYGLLDLQNPDEGFRRQFQASFEKGRETAKGIVAMVHDPAVS